MIENFKCKDTEKLFNDIFVRKFLKIERAARKKLEILEAAKDIEDLKSPPGNRLEKLHGDRKDTYSIRINDQYRLCFAWNGNDAKDAEIVDYH